MTGQGTAPDTDTQRRYLGDGGDSHLERQNAPSALENAPRRTVAPNRKTGITYPSCAHFF